MQKNKRDKLPQMSN